MTYHLAVTKSKFKEKGFKVQLTQKTFIKQRISTRLTQATPLKFNRQVIVVYTQEYELR